MQSQTPFDYLISVTGDCSNNNTGSASVLLTGGTAPYTVEWVDPDLGADVTETEPSVRNNLSVGTYGIRVNDSTLPYNLEFYINIPISNGLCVEIENVSSTKCNLSNGSVTGSSTSDYSSTNFYLYESDGTYVTSGVTNADEIIFDGLDSGIYYIVGEDLGGCSGRTSNFIIEPSSDLDYGLYVVPNSSCDGLPIGKIYVTGQTGTPPYSYLWNNGQTGNTITGLTSGVYSVQVTDSLGCGLTKTAEIIDIDPIGFTYFTSTPPSCFSNDGEITLNVSGGTYPYYYSASTGDVQLSYSDSFTISGLSAGQYNFLVTDAGLCSVSVGTSLTAPLGITSVDIVGKNSFCGSNNGSIIINVDGGQGPYTYKIVNSTGGTDSFTTVINNHTFSNLPSDTYTVTLTDSNGCSKSENITITNTSTFTLSTNVTGTTCNTNNGYIQVSKSSGGALPFTYILDDTTSFSNVATNNVIFNNVSSGSHNIKVIDSTGCTQTLQVYVPPSEPINFSLYKTSCGSGSTGTITAFISSGKPPFNFNWSDNVSGNPQEITVTGLTAGTYSVTIVDDDNCSLTKTTTITCGSVYTSFQTYIMGNDNFQVESVTKYGIPQMLNEGFLDLSSGNTGCSLNSAEFTAKVYLNPSGFTNQNTFYTSTSLIDVPSDNLWYDTIKNLIESIDGVTNVVINELTNQLKIEISDSNTSLKNEEISVELVITYNITCIT